jgi:hypothetical protein
MSVAVTIDSIVAVDPGAGIDFTQSAELVSGTLTLTGNYGDHSPANGDTLDFTGFDKIKSQQIPLWVRIFQYPASPNAPVHYSFLYGYGSDQSDGVLIVIDTTTGLPLTDAAAYPAALTNTDTPPNIRFEAAFPSFV